MGGGENQIKILEKLRFYLLGQTFSTIFATRQRKTVSLYYCFKPNV